MSKIKPRQPAIPSERQETVRREIISVLEGRTLSAKDISAEVRIPEKEVYSHLSHIQRSFEKKEHRLVVIPAECRKCGFVFKKRDRLTKPGKCPICKETSIQEPGFTIQ